MSKKPKRYNLHPNEFEGFWGWLTRNLNVFRNFVRAARHPNLVKPWTIRKYFKVMAVYHRCMHGFRMNHRLAKKNFGHSDPNAFGLQAWQQKDPNYDPNWEVRFRTEDGKAPATEANGEDDRADSDPPKRR